MHTELPIYRTDVSTTSTQTPDLPPLIGPDAAWEAECERDHGPYPAEAPLADRLRWWVPKSAKFGLCAVEKDLLEAAALAAQQAEPMAYASSKRANQILSAAQFKSCTPKIQAEFDTPLYAAPPPARRDGGGAGGCEGDAMTSLPHEPASA